MNKKGGLWAALLVAAITLAIPTVNFVLIRTFVADYHDPEGLRTQDGVPVSHVFLPALKHLRFQEILDGARQIVLLGSSASLIYSKEILADGLGCDIGSFFNYAVHDTDARALANQVRSLEPFLDEDDVVIVVTYPELFWRYYENANNDIYAPWVTGWTLASAAVSYNRSRLVPVFVDLRNMRLSAAYYDSLLGLIRNGPRWQGTEILHSDGSVIFHDQNDVLAEANAGTRPLPRKKDALRGIVPMEYNWDAIDQLGVELRRLKARTVFLEFVAYGRYGGLWEEIYGPDAERKYREVMASQFSGYEHVWPVVEREWDYYYDGGHYLPAGASQSVASARDKLRSALCLE